MVVQGWPAALRYAGCAIGIIVATTTTALVFAALACSMLMFETGDG